MKEKKIAVPALSVVRDEDNGYKTRATFIETDTLQVVIVDWLHPNVGKYGDGGIFVRFLHSHPGLEGWKGTYTAAWMSKYFIEEGRDEGGADVQAFIDDHGEFARLFNKPWVGHPLVMQEKKA